MNKKSLFLGVLVLLFAISAFACINKSGTKYGGGSGSYFGWHGLQAAINKNLHEDGVEMEINLRGSTNFNDRSDYAVALMFLGRSTEAVEQLNKLEQERPGEFFIAANLGTAYELSGNNLEALKWINEGIRRNPKDHEGTEWLHGKILAAKIAQTKDPHYFDDHSVLELRPDQIGERMTIDGKNMSAKELADAIQYQLGERLQFVKSTNPAVASLLYDYASIEAATRSMESAKHILTMATDYGYPAAKVDALNKEFDRRLAWEHFKSHMFYCLIGVLCIALLVLLCKRGIFVLSSKDLKRK
ncbi:MAG TPA: hypothetical protein VNN22_20910 [Verrucomicrobiae bacterium]|nr:hypothetical protein [Verrucomicrobiae bacterium]